MNRQLVLIEKGQSQAVIITGGQASAAELFAAQQLQQYLEAVSGVRLPLKNDDQPCPGPAIAVGRDHVLTRSLITENKLSEDKLGEDGYVIKTSGNHLVLAGRNGCGTLYAVYAFLEHLGCLWAGPGEDIIPKSDSIKIEPLDIIEKPAFSYRGNWRLYGNTVEELIQQVDWVAKTRLNYILWLCVAKPAWPEFREKIIPEIKKRNLRLNFGLDFAFMYFVPPEQYFATHPEYYSLVQGKREKIQLCVSNPEVMEIASANIIRFLKENPEVDIVTLSPCDSQEWCECEKCMAMDQPLKNSEIWQARPKRSNSYFAFVNQVAGRVKKIFPDKEIDYEAYVHLSDAPDTPLKAGENTGLCFSIYMRCFRHPLHEPGCSNERFAKNIDLWTKVVNPKNIKLLDYFYGMANWEGMFFPDLATTAENMRYYRSLGIAGVQGCDARHPYTLNMYVFAELAWNPDRDLMAILKKYAGAYYGAASEQMLGYFLEWERLLQTSKECVYPEWNDLYKILDHQGVKRLVHCLENALIIAKREITPRVKKAKENFDITKIFWQGYAHSEKGLDLIISDNIASAKEQIIEALEWYEIKTDKSIYGVLPRILGLRALLQKLERLDVAAKDGKKLDLMGGDFGNPELANHVKLLNDGVRDAQRIYTGRRLVSVFNLLSPQKWAALEIRGVNGDRCRHPQIRFRLNKETVFEGVLPFAHVRFDGQDDEWALYKITVSKGLFMAKNVLEIKNLGPDFLLIDYVKII